MSGKGSFCLTCRQNSRVNHLPLSSGEAYKRPNFVQPSYLPRFGMLDQKAPAPLRTKDGSIRVAFVRQVTRAIEAGDVSTLRVLVGNLHESDLGAVLEALEPSLRPRLVELLGIDFDFTALTEVDDTVRDEILEELRPQTVAEGVRDIESDDAVSLLEDMPKEDRA